MQDQAISLLGPQAYAFVNAYHESFFADDVLNPAYVTPYTPDVTGNAITVVNFPLTANVVIGAPIGARPGMRLTFVFAPTGVFTVTWNAAFKVAANGAAANAQFGSTTFYYNGTVWVQDAGALTYK